jgi:hypothetical protein
MSSPSSNIPAGESPHPLSESAQPEQSVGRPIVTVRTGLGLGLLYVLTRILGMVYPPFEDATGALLNGVVAPLTLGAIIATAYFTKTLSDTTDKLREVGDEQRKLMAGQLIAMKAEGERAQKTLDQIQRAFLLAHPARLIATNRTVRALPTNEAISTVAFSCDVMNRGDSAAFIVECSICIFLLAHGSFLPNEPAYANWYDERLEGLRLDPGEWETPSCPCTDPGVYACLTKPGLVPGRIIVLGYVRYEDEARSRRKKLGFCYAQEPASQQWVETGGDAYNYAF